MNVLVACEFSGIVRDAFIARGHNAVSCDLLPTEHEIDRTLRARGYIGHIQGDVIERAIKLYDWDLMIAFPPCTYLTNAGVRWMYKNGGGCGDAAKLIIDPKRRGEMLKAATFFLALLNAPIQCVAVENPIQHCFARALIRKQDQIIQPWQFGHNETKQTCLWLKNLPQLVPTKIMPPPHHARVHLASPGPERWKERSRTLQGIADAMANQWGSL